MVVLSIPIASHGFRGGCDFGCIPDYFGGMRELMNIKETISPSQPAYIQEQPKPKVDVKRDERGHISEVKNLTDEEVRLDDGLVLGSRASIDPRGAGRIISGYVIRKGIKYTAEGIIENSTVQIALLDELEEPIILGPRAALTGKGRILTGYLIFIGLKYRAGENMEQIAQSSALPQGTVAMIQYDTVPRSSDERAVVQTFETFLEASYADRRGIVVKGTKLTMMSPTRAQITGTVTTIATDRNGQTSEGRWEFKKQGTRWLLVRKTASP
jgi:hypothetical protein